MSRVLLVDTNFSSGPIYNHLVESGHQVFLVGGNPSDFLAKSLPNYIQIDYTNVPALEEKISEHRIDFVVPGCNDRSYEICSALNIDRRYPGIDLPEATETLNNKALFRRFAMHHGLPVPRLLDASASGSFECRSIVVKPVDAFSGKGVSILHNPGAEQYEEAVRLARNASRSNSHLVEEFVDGRLYSHSAFVKAGKVIVDFIVAEFCTVNPFVVDTSYVDTQFPDSLRLSIRSVIEHIAKSLSFCDGLVHTQFILKNDQFWLIEITRRCPGDLYSQLIELSTGFPYAARYANTFVEKEDGALIHHQVRSIVRHTITQDSKCILMSIQFNDDLDILRFVPIASAGDTLAPSPGGRVGIMFIDSGNISALSDIVGLAQNKKLVSINVYKNERVPDDYGRRAPS